MQRMDLTAAELDAFHAALREPHTRRVAAEVTTLTGDPLADLSGRVVDGEVTVDQDADVTRSLTLTLADPHHTLNFDTDSPDDAALYADRMVRVFYQVTVPALARTVSVPVFVGPVTKLDRTGELVALEAHGKERLAMNAVWRPLTLKKGTRKTTAIRTLLRERAGEDRFDIPDLTPRLPKALSLTRHSVAWAAAQKIAQGMDRQLFYAPTGRATLRQLPDKPVWTFKTGDGGDITGPLAVAHTMDEVVNSVEVVGGKPKGAKKRVRAVAVAESTHPLSPRRLGRNGVGRHLVAQIEDDSIRSEKEANQRARKTLADKLRAVVEVTLDVMPIPHLDCGDLVAADNGDVRVTFRLKQFTIPLGAEGGSMSVGYNRRTVVNRNRIRRP